MSNRGLAAQADFGYDLDPDRLLSVCFNLSKPFNLDAVQTQVEISLSIFSTQCR